MAKFINLTPHLLNINTPSGVVDIPASGDVARVSTAKAVKRRLWGNRACPAGPYHN